jgi:flagellar FliL protein
MAEAKKAEGGDTEEQAPDNKKKKLMMIVVGVVVLALIGAGAAFFLMKKNAATDEEDGDEAPAKTEKVKKAKKGHEDAPPVFVKLDAFTVKLQSEGQEAYLQAVPELRVLDTHLGDKIKQYTPEIRHKVLLLLAGKTASELSTPQGVQKLSNEMRVIVNAIIEPPPARKKGKTQEEPGDQAGPDEPVQAVLFTSFIVQ